MNIRDKKFYPWLVVALLAVVSLLNYLDRQMLATMRPYMMEDIEALRDIANFGRLMAIFLWVYAFMSPLSGVIADRINRKWLIIFSLMIWSGVTLLMGCTYDIHHMYILRGIMGVSEAFYIPAALSLVADYHNGHTRSIAVGALTSGIYLGQAIGGFGATLSAFASWQFTFQSFGLLGLVYAVILAVLLHEKKGHSAVAPAAAGKSKPGKSAIWMLLRHTALWVMLFYFAALNLPGWVTKNWMPTMISDNLGMKMDIVGPMWTVTLAISSFAGVFLGGWISDRWVKKTVRGRIFTSAAGLGMIIPALVLLLFSGQLWMILAGGIVFGIGFGMYDTNNMPIICQFFPSRSRATCYGIMNFVGIAAGALITEVLGYAMEGGYQTSVFVAMIAAVAVSAILELRFMRPHTLDMTDEYLNDLAIEEQA
ncbi:MAG: MFS transporter [Treponema sp.]|nr:MFS transporter [Treponema sp.]